MRSKRLPQCPSATDDGAQKSSSAGAVVFDDVPLYSIAAGNLTRVIATTVKVGPFGCFLDAEPIR